MCAKGSMQPGRWRSNPGKYPSRDWGRLPIDGSTGHGNLFNWFCESESPGNRMSPDPALLLAQIIATLRLRYKYLNLHFEAGWTESWSHRRCLHEHPTL